MSEQQPLLPQSDAEAAGQENQTRLERWRERTGEILESTPIHKLVISLIAIDGSCVLADLGYSFLSNDCEPPEGPDAPRWLEVLALISIVITTLFLVEIPLALFAFGPRFYNPFGRVRHASFHLFDIVIIITTFVLEVVLRGRERELAELLILLRLWRLVKLVGGIAVGAGEIEEETLKELEDTKKRLEDTNRILVKALEENRGLKERILWLERGGAN